MQKTRKLGPTLTTSLIGFGGGSISGDAGGYGFGNITEKQSCDLLQYAFERGIRLFDTAPIYGMGNSEVRMGLGLAKHKDIRSQITLVTKLGVTWDDSGKVFIDNSPENTKRQLETSLKRLQTDYLDLYMVHWPDPKVDIEKTMRVLVDAKAQGTIRAIGICNFDAQGIKRAQTVGNVDVFQNDFSVLNASVRDELFPLCRNEGIGFMSFGTLAKGLLAGTVNSERRYDASDYRSRVPDKFKNIYEALKPQLDEFMSIAKTNNVTPAQLATAWVLAQPETSVALCGSKSNQQIDEVLTALDVSLKSDVVERLNSIAKAATPIFTKMA